MLKLGHQVLLTNMKFLKTTFSGDSKNMTELRNLADGISSEGLFNSGMSAHSPEFLLVDEESSSTYPLLTPSPTTEFEHPLALDTPPGNVSNSCTHEFRCVL